MPQRFGELLVDEGYATEEQIVIALAYERDLQILVGQILVDMHRLTHGQQDEIEAAMQTSQ
ncbi:MAG: hypothetical protein QGH20_08315 [Candidatus Latescibacteria bacterium]|nr:hypothetical protein [Candidatus Latescibacterota bacterium]